MKLFDFENALTYDDILILPGASSVLPSETILKTTLARDIELNIPILSAAMDTVTESAMAIALAREGGMGVIHKNLTPENQAKEVAKVKRIESGIIIDPVTLDSNSLIADAIELGSSHNVSGFPVVTDGKLVGILTNRDYQFETKLSTPVQELMTPIEDIVTASPDIEIEKAKELLRVNRLEKLPLVDDEMHLCGLITMKDIHNTITHPNACKDSSGSLRVGAAVGVGEKALERADGLVKAGVDCLFIDTAHGHSSRVIDMTAILRRKYPDIALVAGNVVTPEAVEA
ncbi:MAG: IMP dehydrogenase, partial [FCB group bacterium]|nr:IMP dehydrogenase [FCB group bacterium]